MLGKFGVWLLLIPTVLAAQEATETTDPAREAPEASDQTTAATPARSKIPDIATDEQLDPVLARQTLKKRPKEVPPTEQFVQEINPAEINTADYKSLRLGDAIEQGLRTSEDQAVRDLKSKYLDLEWDRTFQYFWYPRVTLSLSTEPFRMARLKSGNRDRNSYVRPGGGTLSLEVEDYTIFNWGKDYQLYLNNKDAYLRRQERLTEDRRNLKQNIIYAYFQLYTTQEIEKVLRQQLRQASFIYRLNRERVAAGKTSKQEYFQARHLYLTAQQKYFAGQTSFQQACEQIATYLHDPSGTRYVAVDPLIFRKYEGTLAEEIRLGKDNNPSVRDAQTAVQQQDRFHQIAQIDRLPLPRISLRLGAYRQDLGPQRTSPHWANAYGEDHIDVTAQINATWDLVGPEGFLNARQSKAKFLGLQIAQHEHQAAQDSTEGQIRQIHQALLLAQNDVIVHQAQVENAKQQYDTAINNYLKQRTTFLDYQQTLEDRTQAEISWHLARFDHVAQKIALAKAMGVENPPTEILERLIGQGE